MNWDTQRLKKVDTQGICTCVSNEATKMSLSSENGTETNKQNGGGGGYIPFS